MLTPEQMALTTDRAARRTLAKRGLAFLKGGPCPLLLPHRPYVRGEAPLFDAVAKRRGDLLRETS